MQRDPAQILQKQHAPLAREHYHLRFGAQFHPKKIHIEVAEVQQKQVKPFPLGGLAMDQTMTYCPIINHVQTKLNRKYR